MTKNELNNLIKHLNEKIGFWQGQGRADRAAEYIKEVTKAAKKLEAAK
jgi:hypothetical protein